jgi:hypothetical protein
LTRSLPRRTAFLLAVFLPAPGAAYAAGSKPADRCLRLVLARHPGLEIVSARRVPAGEFTAGAGEAIAVPDSCRIAGVARPTADSRIGFELWLPEDWNGRYAQLGNGGFAGNIDASALAAEIGRGNAAAMTDTGHTAGQFDASWALGHPERIVDYGYRSITATAGAAGKLIRDYYGRPARRRYFIGCSNGGRQALMAAQRYPGDWDGILAGSPAIGWTRQLATFAAIQHRLRASPENWIPADKLPAIQRSAIAACANASGDHPVLSQARQCPPDAGRLVCRAAGPDCLTAPQAATLQLIEAGPGNARGEPLFYGFDPRAAALPGNWDRWILNPDPEAPSELAFATEAYRYLILDRPDWNIGEFNLDRDFALASERRLAGRPLSAILDADDPDLGRFAAHGGKLVMYLGGSDALISPGAGLAYYLRVMLRMGASRTMSFARLFVVPEMQHCQGGPGPNAFGQAWVAPGLGVDARHDIRSALEAWVEHGRSPISLVAAKYEDDSKGGAVVATRELRPYPQPPRPVSFLP